jgi:hypothetical protein
MPQLDRLKEQIAYLKFWRGALTMEILAAVVMLAVALVFFGIALDASRKAK